MKINIENGRLEHAIGLSNCPRFYGNRYGTFYKAYRNYYTIAKGRTDKKIIKLVEQGLMIENFKCYFSVTEEGYKHLEKKYNIRIVRY